MLKSSLTATLARVVKLKAISESHSLLLASRPLVEMDDLEPSADTEWSRYVAAYPTKDFTLMDREDFIFLSAIYSIPRYGFYYLHIHPTDMPVNRSFTATLEYYPVDTKVDGAIITEIAYDGDSSSPLTFIKTIIKSSVVVTNSRELITDMAGNFLIALKMFMQFQESLDRYPVEVRNTRTRLNRGNPKAIDTKLMNVHHKAPRLIYLNQLPSTSTADSKGTGEPTGSRAMHQRKGHWKTLTHERYRGNPKFGIENGVRVKPSWVGVRETLVAGNVYKVILKEALL